MVNENKKLNSDQKNWGYQSVGRIQEETCLKEDNINAIKI